MVLGPGVVALLLSSTVVCVVVAAAAWIGSTLAFGWSPDRHDAAQLTRERRGLLVESALTVVLGCQLLSVFLFVHTVDRLHPLITGAMCAAGALQASRFGYPTLIAKVVVFLLCGLWRVVDRATAGALVRGKHATLPVLFAALVAENVLQWRYFVDLDPAVITSCCATTFATGGSGLGAGLAALPVTASRIAFFTVLASTLVVGTRAVLRGRTTGLFAVLAGLLGVVAAAALVTWVAPAFYELPNHHCPFCLLSARAGRIGYVLFASLALAVVCGVGAGVVGLLRALDATRSVPWSAERRLCAVSMSGFVLFATVAAWPMLASGLQGGRY